MIRGDGLESMSPVQIRAVSDLTQRFSAWRLVKLIWHLTQSGPPKLTPGMIHASSSTGAAAPATSAAAAAAAAPIVDPCALAVARVSPKKHQWAALPAGERAKLLGEMLRIYSTIDHEAWAKEAMEAQVPLL